MNLKRLTEAMQAANVANMIVSDPYSIRYLTGYYTDPGERLLALIVPVEGPLTLILNDLFPPYQHLEGVNVVTYHDGEPAVEAMAEHLLDGVTSIDKYWPSHFLLRLMQAEPNLQPVDRTDLIDGLRAIKTEEELAIMREASRLNDQVMAQVIKKLEEDPLSEREMADYAKQLYAETGHESVSFEPIIAYGANGSDPHHVNGDATLKQGDLVIIDIGGLYKGYASDMTRTICVGTPRPRALEVYRVVKHANEAAIEAVKPGVPLCEIDQTARRHIDCAGYGKYFTHRLGHFIGQEAHEAGDVSKFNEEPCQVNQVFSIEPGVYLPDNFGVRIEDLVAVTEDGCEVLNHFTKELLIINPDLSDH